MEGTCEAAVQEGFGVKFRGVTNPGQLLGQLVDFSLDLGPVCIGVGVRGCLDGQLPHPLQDGVGFVEGTFCRLDKADGVLGIPDGLVQAPDLAPHFLGNGQARGVVSGPVDPHPGRKFF